MTINKAQGQTIPFVGVSLPQNVFSHGQLYVALLHGTSFSTTKVFIKETDHKSTRRTYTKNVVYTKASALCRY